MTERKEFSLRRLCEDFYSMYEGDKVCFSTFYNRVRTNPDEDMEKCLKREEKKPVRRPSGVFTGPYAEEMRWWFIQGEPKSNKQVFYGRVKAGYPKEQAILTGDKWLEVSGKKKSNNRLQPKSHIFTKQEKQAKEEEYTGIDITYPKEVARIFRKEFHRVIDDLEWSLTMIDEKTQVKETNDKLELAKAELAQFNLYNK